MPSYHPQPACLLLPLSPTADAFLLLPCFLQLSSSKRMRGMKAERRLLLARASSCLPCRPSSLRLRCDCRCYSNLVQQVEQHRTSANANVQPRSIPAWRAPWDIILEQGVRSREERLLSELERAEKKLSIQEVLLMIENIVNFRAKARGLVLSGTH